MPCPNDAGLVRERRMRNSKLIFYRFGRGRFVPFLCLSSFFFIIFSSFLLEVTGLTSCLTSAVRGWGVLDFTLRASWPDSAFTRYFATAEHHFIGRPVLRLGLVSAGQIRLSVLKCYCITTSSSTSIIHIATLCHSITMAVMQPVSLFEEIERPTTPPHKQSNVSSRIRLQLQTMFHHQHSSRSKDSARSSTSTPSSSVHSSPTPSYRSYSPRSFPTSPASDLSALFTPLSTSRSPSYTRLARLRRQPSAIDLVLEAERSAVGPETLGLALLEPRPRAPSSGSTSSECSIMEFMNEHQTPRAGEAVVLDGILEVLERS